MTEDSSTNERRNNPRGGSVHELLTSVISNRAHRDQVKLRPYINGTVLFQLTDSKKNYIFDWSSEKLRAEPVTKPEEAAGAECTIRMNENVLSQIAAGDINPQIAMLSNKVNVSGKVAYAVYIFNLIAP